MFQKSRVTTLCFRAAPNFFNKKRNRIIHSLNRFLRLLVSVRARGLVLRARTAFFIFNNIVLYVRTLKIITSIIGIFQEQQLTKNNFVDSAIT